MESFFSFYRGLPMSDRAAYAERCGTTRAYIEVHLLGRRKFPTVETMERFAAGSDGKLTYEDVLKSFYIDDDGAAPRRRGRPRKQRD